MSLVFLPTNRRLRPTLLALFSRRNRRLLGSNLFSSNTVQGGETDHVSDELLESRNIKSPFATDRFDWRDPLQMRTQLTEEEASSVYLLLLLFGSTTK
jgi:hypothetical protein